MIRALLSRIYWWSHRQSTKRHARKRLAELERRLVAHDQDIANMRYFPATVQNKMKVHRKILVVQIENLKKNIA